MKKYEALYRRIKSDIETGLLPEGERLASIRKEARSSGLSINTVISAYELLVDEGLVRTRPRGGYYVCPGAPELTKEGIGEVMTPSGKYAATAREAGERLDQLYERLLHIDSSFAAAAPGLDILPVESLRRITAGMNGSWMEYNNPEGDYELRRRIALVNRETDGAASPDGIIVTNGATEALAVVLQAFLNPGDTVALESPTYLHYFRQLAPLGVDIVEIPLGSDGMDLEILGKELKKRKVRMIVVQPNVQNPAGVTMSDKAKKNLIALAEKHGVHLVQDDVYGDLYFGPFRPRNLSFFSDYPGIILISSYSKSVSPGLRIGWIRSHRYAGKLTEEKLRISMDSCRAAQAIAAAFIGTRAHRHHLRIVRKELESRIDRHMERLAEILPKGSSVRRPTGGCLLWIALPSGTDAVGVFERAAGKGLITAPGALFSMSDFFNSCLRLNAGGKLTKQRSETLGFLASC